MNLRQKITLGFLILGFIFSSIIRIRFNIDNGFEFHNLWITWIPSFFNFALLSSSEQTLTTTFLGYSFFIASGFLMLKPTKGPGAKNKGLVFFLGLVAFALTFELISLFQDLFFSYYGQHLRMGLLIFLLGIIIFRQTLHSSKIIEKLHPE